MYKLRNKRNHGITLIALVITIIVLLILAAISITMLTGDNSILKRAVDAKERTELSSLKEEAQMVMLNRVTEKTTLGSNTKTLKEDLESGISNATVESINKTEEFEGLTDVYYVSKNGQYVTIYEDGDIEDGQVEIWDGKKVSSPKFKKENNIWNWYIYTPGQLKFLADFVNNGNSLTGTVDLTSIVTDAGYNTSDVVIAENQTKVYLMNNLDMGARPGAGSTEEQKWETSLNEAKKWEPIGIDNETKKFIGIFEGNNKTIKYLYVNSTKSDAGNGIFGNSNTIQNLTIANSYIKGTSCTGGIVGALRLGKIENCHNKNTTVILREGTNRAVGGIVGQASASVSKCSNTGSIFGYGIKLSSENSQPQTRAGGVIGYLTNSSTASECNNSGAVIGSGNYTGGVCGSANLSTVTQCDNSGSVTGNGNGVGGISGYSTGTTEKCSNSGNVTGNGNGVGGISGSSTGTTEKCSNSGKVTGNGSYVGGISGFSSGATERCSNSGTIKQTGGKGGLGGVVGETGMYCTANILNCYNTGKVVEEANSTSGVGGIVGYISATGASGKISHNYSIGEIEIKGTGVTLVGGAIGRYTNNNFEINNNYYELNKSSVTLNNLGEGLLESQMKTQSFVDLLNGEQNPLVWELGVSNNGYPTLKE